MPETSLENNTIIYQEMMSHPALFSHPCPQKIALVGDQQHHILTEVLKHPSIMDVWQISNDRKDTSDTRVQPFSHETSLSENYFDIVIVANPSEAHRLKHYYAALNAEGILLQLSDSPFHVQTLKTLQRTLHDIGFADSHIVTYPQPQFMTGWRCAVIAKKTGIFRKIREKAIFNKSFTTQYYNLDVHKASLVMPEFMRTALTL